MNHSLVSVVRLVDLLGVIRDGRTLVVVNGEYLSVNTDLSLLDRDGFLWIFPVFSTDREVYTSVIVFFCS